MSQDREVADLAELADLADLAERRRFRDAMGRFATGVTIISTVKDGEVHGMTANGFMSVSLQPRLVVISVANHTRMRGLLDASGRYGVSVLSHKHQALSDHFGGRKREGLDIGFVEVEGVPLIPDALTRVAARVVDAHPAGDHTLFVGEVLDVAMEAGDPLIFHSGAYRELLGEEDFTARWAADERVWF